MSTEKEEVVWGQRGVKISKDNQEIRVKPYGDIQVFGKCIKGIRTKEGTKISLYWLMTLKAIKNARAQNHRAP